MSYEELYNISYVPTKGIFQKLSCPYAYETKENNKRFARLNNPLVAKRAQQYYEFLDPNLLTNNDIKEEFAILLSQREHASRLKMEHVERIKGNIAKDDELQKIKNDARATLRNARRAEAAELKKTIPKPVKVPVEKKKKMSVYDMIENKDEVYEFYLTSKKYTEVAEHFGYSAFMVKKIVKKLMEKNGPIIEDDEIIVA